MLYCTVLVESNVDALFVVRILIIHIAQTLSTMEKFPNPIIFRTLAEFRCVIMRCSWSTTLNTPYVRLNPLT